MVIISMEFLLGSIMGAFSVLSAWVFSLEGRVGKIDGTLEEHLRKNGGK